MMRHFRIVIVLKNAGFLRYNETQIEGLCLHGHSILFLIQDSPITDGDGLLEQLSSRYPKLISVASAPPRRDGWTKQAVSLRAALDYCRYLRPDFAGATGLRERAELKPLRFAHLVADLARRLGATRSGVMMHALLALLRSAYSSLPPDPAIVKLLRDANPDLVLTTGSVWLRSEQAEYVLAGRSLGVQTGYVVNSWDNLTNKGDIKAVPDLVYVWNAEQKAEAERLHGVPGRSVRITGAPLFDRWFDREPSETRTQFCRRVGLPDDGPYYLYTCSSPRIAPAESERQFFHEWLMAREKCGVEEVRSMNILVRPHPHNSAVWRDFRGSNPGVAVHPQHGRWIVGEADRDDYFNALYYCSAAIGINTSAMLEAAIVGARTFTIQNGGFTSMQDGTIHFRYLTSLGIAETHGSLQQHFAALAQVSESASGGRRKPLPGAIAFVRPQGLDLRSTDVAVAAIEAQAGTGIRRRVRVPFWRPLLRYVHWSEKKTGTKAARPPASTLRDAIEERSQGRARLQDYYGDALLPKLLSFGIRNLPPHRFLLKNFLTEQLNPRELARFAASEAALTRTIRAKDRIFVGPWISEVGFEVLYWIPFVRWFSKKFRIDPSRIVAISRGGVSDWYAGICGEYVDVFDIYTPEQYLAKNLERTAAQKGKQKQWNISQMESDIYREVQEKLDLKRFTPFHPDVMFRLYSRFWKDISSVGLVNQYSMYRPISMSPSKIAELCPGLPKKYVAVKFYARDSLPDTEANRAFIADVIRRLARYTEVVVLSTEVKVDDHADFSIKRIPGVHIVDPMVDPAKNLAMQTAIIAGSEAYVGTYGGMTYVANYLGKTSICFESEPSHNRPMHTELALRKLRIFGGNLYVLNTRDTLLFDWLVGGVASERRTSGQNGHDGLIVPTPDDLALLANSPLPGDAKKAAGG